MNTIRVPNKIAVIVCTFVFIVFAAAPLLGQEEEYEAGYPRAAAYWNIDVNENGEANTTLSVYDLRNAANTDVIKDELVSGLRNALQCELTQVRFGSVRSGVSIIAGCQLPVQRRDMVVQGTIKPDFVWKVFQKTELSRLNISLRLPRLGYAKGPKGGKEVGPYGVRSDYMVEVKAGQPAIDDFSFECGYHKSGVILVITVLTLILGVPVVLILHVRKRSLMLADVDATAAWFGYWRVHLWIVQGMWITWFMTLVSSRANAFLDFVFGIDVNMVFPLILFVPPGVVSLLCHYLSRPVWFRVRGISWNKGEMLIRGFAEHAVAFLPLAFAVYGVMSFFQGSGKAALWFAGAMVAMLGASWLYGKVSGTLPRALLGGELNERVLELAQQAGVKIRQVFLMPAQPYQMGNAFAMTGNKVMITDYLLERLTKRETDSVMAHEIGHLKRHHTLLMSWVGLLVFLLAVNFVLRTPITAFLSFAEYFGESTGSALFAVMAWIDTYLLDFVLLLIAWLLWLFISKRFERSADEFSTILTGDPESMITGLVKLSKMNLVPIRWGFWDEALGTHPATIKRMEAIAQRHRIPKERLQILLETPPHRSKEEAYEIAPEVSDPALVFSAEFKTQKTLLISLILLLSLAITPLLTGHLLSEAGLPSSTFLLGLLFMPMVYLIVANYASLLGYSSLGRKMRKKLARSGIDFQGHQPYFVGISPEEHPRVYENHSVWDVGFLLPQKKALTYYGDKISFGIPRDRIISITRGPSFPGWFVVPEIYVRWNDGNKERVLHLHSVDGNSMISIAKKTKSLLLSLLYWHQSEESINPESSRDNPALAEPEFTEIKGDHPRQLVTFGGALTSLVFVALLVFGLSALFQLDSSVSWYGFGMGAWCLILGFVPNLRYKEEDSLQQ